MAAVDAGARERAFTWKDPMLSAGLARTLPGIEFLRGIRDGTIPNPPITDMMNYRLAEVEPGVAVFEIEPAEYHYNPIGVVHGGVALTLLDSAMSCAVQTMLPAGTGYTTLEVKVNLVRAITSKAGVLRAEGQVVHSGSRVATAEGRIVDRDGKLYAHGSTTCLIMAGEQKK